MPSSPSVDNLHITLKGIVAWKGLTDQAFRDVGNVPTFVYYVERGIGYVAFVIEEITKENLQLLNEQRRGDPIGTIRVDATNDVGPKVNFCANVKVKSIALSLISDDWSKISVVAEHIEDVSPFFLNDEQVTDGW